MEAEGEEPPEEWELQAASRARAKVQRATAAGRRRKERIIREKYEAKLRVVLGGPPIGWPLIGLVVLVVAFLAGPASLSRAAHTPTNNDGPRGAAGGCRWRARRPRRGRPGPLKAATPPLRQNGFDCGARETPFALAGLSIARSAAKL